MVNSATVDDLRIEACIYEFLRTLRTGEFLSCGTNMRGGMGTKIAAIIHTDAEWAVAKTLLATLENVVVEAESKHGAVVWSSAQNDPPTIPTDSFPLQLIVSTGNEIQRHLPETFSGCLFSPKTNKTKKHQVSTP